MKKLFKQKLRTLTLTIGDWITQSRTANDERILNLCASTFISQAIDLTKANDAFFVTGLVRDMLAPMILPVRQIKRPATMDGSPAHARFRRLIETLEDIPPLPGADIVELVKMADSYVGNTAPVEMIGGDVAWHFRISSSFAKKGRVLYTVVRFMRPTKVLEAGTAYGMSAAFMLHGMARFCEGGRLWTIEAGEPQFSLASEALRARFTDKVVCRRGFTKETLPAVVADAGKLDLFFHDAGHSKEDYVTDFGMVVENLMPGSVVVIDDITWNDERFVQEDPRCYEGWLEIVRSPRVEWAIEIGSSLGLALLR